jgi:drug/metabolite transporter (DMT)-like permease
LIYRDTYAGVLFALIAAVGFSAKAILIKLAYLDHVDAITLLALRMLFALPFFIGVAIWLNFRDHHPLKLQDWIAVIVLGLMGYYLSSFLDFLGLLYITAGLERLILFLYPTMTVILSAIIYKNAIGKKIIMAMALSYFGIALVFIHDVKLSHVDTSVSQSEIWLGAGLVFASALSYSSYLVGAGHAIRRMGATRFTAYASIVASFASLLQFVLTHPMSSLNLSYRVYELSIAMAIFSTVMPVFMLSYAIHRIGSGSSSLIGSVGPIATIGLAYVFLHEPITFLQIAGTILVLAGVLMISLNSTKTRSKV